MSQLVLQVNEGKAGGMPWFKLHQDVYVAVGAKIFAQDGAEQGQFANIVLLAKLSNLLFGD